VGLDFNVTATIGAIEVVAIGSGTASAPSCWKRMEAAIAKPLSHTAIGDLLMEIRKVPYGIVFKTRVRDESIGGENPFRWQDLSSDEIFKGRRVVVFSLPGAFTPTCSNRQCPAFDALYSEIRAQGVDEVYCLTVNDAFVVYQWARHLGIKNVKFIPDGSGWFTGRMGMLVNKEHLGFGYRSWRYTMVVDDGLVEKWFEEPGINDVGADEDPYTVTAPEVLLDYLRNAQRKNKAA
jgi:peroxiredoxin